MSELDHHDYLSKQLIAYIGNKRRLSGFLSSAFSRLAERHSIRTFADPFAGSGAVSRLAKHLGYEVFANDWEDYAYIVNLCHVGVDEKDIPALFRSWRGIDAAFEDINRLSGPFEPYISRYYAPRSTSHSDYRCERLFYTRENAEFLDRVRSRIEDIYPGWNLPEISVIEKTMLLSSLLYEASTHANTSGVFKAYHKGFGGYGRDALGRILGPMRCERPILINGRKARVSRLDAREMMKPTPVDLCYLDPPYNQHQYGSNYHLLNTIVRWDQLAVDCSYDERGRLRDKAGIRKDWRATRSEFCYRDKALQAFAGLFDAIDARFIALSYNTEGIVSIEELADLLGSRGKIEFFYDDYVLYRGGRQSMRRKTYNAEYLMVVTTEESRGRGRNLADVRKPDPSIRRFLTVQEIRSLLKSSFSPERVQASFIVEGEEAVLYRGREKTISVQMDRFYTVKAIPDHDCFSAIGDDELLSIRAGLAFAACSSKHEEVGIILSLLKEGGPSRFLFERLLNALKKFAFKKYRDEFEEAVRSIEEFIQKSPAGCAGLSAGLERVKRTASLRFSG